MANGKQNFLYTWWGVERVEDFYEVLRRIQKYFFPLTVHWSVLYSSLSGWAATGTVLIFVINSPSILTDMSCNLLQ